MTSIDSTPGTAPSAPYPYSFLIAGIGASAGGLRAFQELLENLPEDPGLALVLVPHLSPSHESMMVDILRRSTRLPIREVMEEIPVERNHIYVIPPNTVLGIAQGKFQLTRYAPAPLTRAAPAPLTRAAPAPLTRECIDHFLISLAEEVGGRCAGVVLSGTASDGAAGIGAVKAEGGITFAQDQTAEFPGMPEAAVATGAVDFILPPKEIARELGRIARHPYVARDAAATAPAEAEPVEGDLARILDLLKDHTGVAFAQYKPTTVRRRIARRMAVCKVEQLDDYIRFLDAHPEELRMLHDDILVNVTSFFRDPESFQALKDLVFPRLLETRPARSPIRVWVPGCATGEEPFSIAMSLLEYLEEKRSQVGVQIFATDLNEGALARGRLGIYEQSIDQDLSPERLRRFFTATDGGRYQISKRVRDLCLFARHDLTNDPPFSKIDLVSCRNVLIYLGPSLQKRVIPLLHYSLKPGGVLLLGTSESVERFGDLFVPMDRKQKLYTKQLAAQSGQIFTFTSDRVRLLQSPAYHPVKLDQPPPAFDLGREVDRLLAREFVPAGLVVGSEGQVLELRGDTAPFLRQSSGRPALTIQKMVQPELLPEVESALREARVKGQRVRRESVEFRSGDRLRKVAIEVRALPAADGGEAYFIVLFNPETSAPDPVVEPRTLPAGGSEERLELEREIERLRHTLDASREYQQSIIEKIETSNEELRSSHEEVLSSNEELQSTNEELETAKEELQSANEELTTLNEELHQRNQELAQSNSDLANILSSVQIPIAIVDTELRLRRVTPAGEKLLNVLPTDVNRRITDFKYNLDVQNLEALLGDAITNLSTIEQDVTDRDGRWYSLRIRPYRSAENRIEGAVIMVVDIDAVKRIALEHERARAFSELVIDAVPYALLVLDLDLRVARANDAFYTLFKVTREETENRLVYEIGGRQWDIPKLRELLGKILPENSRMQDFEVEFDFPGVGKKTVLLHARKLTSWHTRAPMIVLAIEDVTHRIQAEREVRHLNVALEGRVLERTSQLERSKGEMEAFTYSVAHDLRAPLRAMHGFAQIVLDDYRGKPLDQEGVENLQRIIDSSAKMDALIQDLLTYSRLSREGFPLEAVDLGPVVRDVLEDLSGEISSRRAVVNHHSVDCRVMGNPAALTQVLSNLLTNALKFVAPGTVPQIRIRCDVQDGRATLWVEDNGIGIAPEFHERIFRVFERLNHPESYPGTGIGLAIVRTAVEKMGGTVGLESAPGKGSRFFVDLAADGVQGK